jgi:serine/threonine protein kinase
MMSIHPSVVIDGKFRIVRLIGSGGMGAVYEGENIRIGRRVAIKVLRSETPRSSDLLARFQREARTAAQILHPHICAVLDLGDLPGGEHYIVMEYLEGETLEDRLGRVQRLSPQQLAPMAFELLDGLAALHEAGVVHRDVKPANVFLARTPGRTGRGETVKIVDFGISKNLPVTAGAPMTVTGVFIGTPLYMSPEQVLGRKDIDGRSDVYAAGIVIYRAVTGQMPFLGHTVDEVLFRRSVVEPTRPDLIDPSLDRAFSDIVMRMLAHDRDARFTAREAQLAIEDWGRDHGISDLAFAATTPAAPLEAPAGRRRAPSLLLASTAAAAMAVGAAAMVLHARGTMPREGLETDAGAVAVGTTTLRSATVPSEPNEPNEPNEAEDAAAVSSAVAPPTTAAGRRLPPAPAPTPTQPKPRKFRTELGE